MTTKNKKRARMTEEDYLASPGFWDRIWKKYDILKWNLKAREKSVDSKTMLGSLLPEVMVQGRGVDHYWPIFEKEVEKLHLKRKSIL